MTPEQQRALAIARARRRRAEAQNAAPAAPPMQAGQVQMDAATGAPVAQLPPRGDAPPSPAPAQPAGPQGFLQTADGLGAALFDGARQGVSMLLGAPVDLVNNAPRLANLLPGVEGVGPMTNRPFGGREMVDQILRLGGLVPDFQPRTGPERIVNRMGEELGATAVPVAGVIGRANSGINSIARASGGRTVTAPQNIFAQQALTASQKPITTNVGERVGTGVASMFSVPAKPLAAAGSVVDDFVNGAAMAGRNLYLDGLRTAAVNPAGLAGREALYAGGAGLGAGAAIEAFGDNNAADIGGSVAGTLATGGVAGLLGALGNGAAAVTGSTRFVDDVASSTVADRLINSSARMQEQAANLAASGLPPNQLSTEGLVRDLRTPAAVETAVPGYRVNIADRTQDPGLATFTFDTDAVSTGAATARRAGNDAAVNARMTELAPEGDPSRFRTNLQSGVDNQIAQAQTAQEAVQGVFDNLTQALQPIMREASARGSSIRSALADAYGAAQERVRGLYGQIDSDGTLVDPAPLVQSAKAVDMNLAPNDAKRFRPTEASTIQEMMPGDRAPLRDTGLVNEFNRPVFAENAPGPANPNNVPAMPGEAIGRPGTTVPLSDITAIRSGLTDDLRAAQASGQTQQARVLNQYIDAIDGYMDEALPGDLRAALDEARAARRDVGERFERPGTALESILSRREGGGFALDDSAVPSRIAQPDQGRLSDLKAALSEAGQDPRLRDGLADQVRSDVTTRGLLDKPQALGKYMAERQVLLSEFPELRTQLEQAGATRADLAAAEKAATETTKRLTTPGRSAEASYLASNVDDPSGALLRAALSKPDRAEAVRDLLRTSNSPTARQDLRAALWEEVKRTGRLQADGPTGETRWNGKKLRAMFEDPNFAPVARELWADDPQDLANIKQVFDALGSAESSVRARAPGSSGTAQALSGRYDPTTSIASIASSARSVQRNQMAPSQAVIYHVTGFLRRRSAQVQSRAIDQITATVVNNPGMAADLLERYNPANMGAYRNMLTQKYGVRAATLLNILDEAENEDPVLDAVEGK